MSRHAFFIAGDRLIRIANPCGAGLQYQAQAQVLAPQVLAGPFSHENAETIIVVEEGTIELAVNGAAGHVGAGSYVRIAAGVSFSYRNAGSGPARLLSRTARATKAREACRVTIQIAAA